MRRLIGIFLLLLAALPAFGAPNAVAQVNTEAWYAAKTWTGYPVPHLTEGYAPFPVFFEGWASTPRESLTGEDAYTWDFGDGSPAMVGFCAAHVYEAPGVYTVTLTVEDNLGATDTDTLTIRVNARAGRTFYVNAISGNDSNDGLAADRAWQTATKALGYLCGNNNIAGGSSAAFFQSGDRVLFERGQTFDLWPGRVKGAAAGKSGYGVEFAARDGLAPKPIIQRTLDPAHPENDTLQMILFSTGATDACHLTFRNLMFDGTAPGGAVGGIVQAQARATNWLFLDCDFVDGDQSITLGFNITTAKMAGMFLDGCTITNANNHATSGIQTYFRGARVAVLGTTMEYSGNHAIYGSWLDAAVFQANTLKYPAFGRTCLRIAAGSDNFALPSKNIYVRGNTFTGWVDPVISPAGIPNPSHNGGGVRYNFVLNNVAPQNSEDQSIEWVVWENNTVSDFECGLNVSACENVWVRNNVFTTPSAQPGPRRLIIGQDRVDQRPTKNLWVTGNTFVTQENRSGQAANKGLVMHLAPYTGPAYQGMTQHEDITITGNTFTMQNETGYVMWFERDLPGQIDQITMIDNTLTGVDPNGPKVVKAAGAHNAAGTTEWTWNEWLGREGGNPPDPPPDPQNQRRRRLLLKR
jgi:PKD repeat protein